MDEVERKRKASGSSNVADDDDDHLQQQILIQQLSSCCPCVYCHCRCHDMINTETTAAIEDAAYLDSLLPIGYRFNPTDKELITHYLLKKIQNQTLPKNKISEANVYQDHPKNLVGNYPQATEGVWYFFTSRNRKYIHGKRPNRKAGSGYWKATSPDKVIQDNGIKIGASKSLVYHEGHPPNGTNTNWMMHEYVVEGYERQRSDLADMKLDDYVLCKIFYRADRRKQIIECQAVTNQQPGEAEASNETLRTNLEVENQRALFPYQNSCLSSNQDVYSSPNLNPATLVVENNFRSYNQNLKDQQAHVVTNQDTSLTNENINVISQHLDDQYWNHAAIHHVENSIPVQSSNQHMNPLIVQNGDQEGSSHVMVHDQQACAVSHAAIHHVENSIPVQSSNQHMNPLIVQNRDEEEANRHVMVHDQQQARVVSHQNLNNPTIRQVRNNVVVQNVGSMFDIIPPGYMMPPPRPLQMRGGYQRMIHPLAHHSSQPSGFNHHPQYLPSTPRRSPPLPPRIVPHPAGMYPSDFQHTQSQETFNAQDERELDSLLHNWIDADDLGRTKSR